MLFPVVAAVLLGTFLIYGLPAALGASLPVEFSGMVWERHGAWHLNGSPALLRLGEAIAPGGLLTAGDAGASPSIVILLPDGQRMLCECYNAAACSQGFRIPEITPRPSTAVWALFVAVRNILLLRPAADNFAFPRPVARAAMAGNIEMVAALSPQAEISIASALRVLPAGHYSLAVVNDSQPAGTPTHSAAQPLEWTASQEIAQVRVAGPGIYRLRVSDQSFVPRLEIEVLATTPASLSAESEKLTQARETVMRWNRTHPGWSLHDFLRVYLESRAQFPQQ